MASATQKVLGALRQRIASGLHLGTLAHGARLPSTRQVADEIGVTPRTVMAAYRELAAEGLVELRPRSGIYVAAAHAMAAPMLPQMAGWMVDVLVQGLSRNIPPVEFPERARRCLETLRLRAACIESNADQLYSICTELQGDYGFETSPVASDALAAPTDATQLALRRADLLVTTTMHSLDVKRAARLVQKPWVVISLRVDLMSEVTRLLARGPVYFVATDPRVENVVRDIFGPTGYAPNVRLVILGRDDAGDIPPDAPTYVMPRARERLGDGGVGGRVIPAQRVFSLESAREILSFIVRANIAAMASRTS